MKINQTYIIGVVFSLSILTLWVQASAEDMVTSVASTNSSYTFLIQASINNVARQVKLDTGAVLSTLAPNKQTLSLPTAGFEYIEGAGESSMACDKVSAAHVSLDSRQLTNKVFLSCPQNPGDYSNFGLDMLAGTVFNISFSQASFTILPSMPTNLFLQSLSRGSQGHILLPIAIAGKSLKAIFDTGFAFNAIDSAFIASHPTYFTRLEEQYNSSITDLTGKTFDTVYYRVRDLQVGTLNFSGQIVQAITLSEEMSKTLGAAFVIGSNTIINADWYFDLKNNKWAAVSRMIEPQKKAGQ